MTRKIPFLERMNSHTSTSDPDACWLWGGYRDRYGYGRVRGVLAHRISYTLFVGEIPAGLQLDHLCRNRSCINPRHLEPVTARENTLRGLTGAARNALKTHCPQGHPYDEANTVRDSNGARRCRTCRRARYRRAVA